jgi:hypothetical protein
MNALVLFINRHRQNLQSPVQPPAIAGNGSALTSVVAVISSTMS